MWNIECEGFLATTEDEISRTTIDFWSVVHILAGIAIFVFLFLLVYWLIMLRVNNNNVPEKKCYWITIIITLILAILWEVIENTIMLTSGFKTKPDSECNMILDVIFVVGGGFISWLTTYFALDKKNSFAVYLIYGILCLTLWIIETFIFGYFTIV
jgi:hypothetical protein